MITREELEDWLDGCPCEEWFTCSEDEGIIHVAFCFDPAETEEDEDC